jgi:proline iminopeptidase
MEYALAHGAALKGLIISNMMSSCPAYNQYAENVLMPQMDQALLGEAKAFEAAGDYQNPRYMEILTPLHYEKHVLRMPAAEWPDPVVRAFARLNYPLYLKMQGPSELGLSGDLAQWDRTNDLQRIKAPTLVTVAAHDTMDPAFMRKMAGLLPKGRVLDLPDGSHMAMYDDQARYMSGLTGFLRDVAKGRR